MFDFEHAWVFQSSSQIVSLPTKCICLVSDGPCTTKMTMLPWLPCASMRFMDHDQSDDAIRHQIILAYAIQQSFRAITKS